MSLPNIFIDFANELRQWFGVDQYKPCHEAELQAAKEAAVEFESLLNKPRDVDNLTMELFSNLFLPYVTLAYLESVSQSHPELRELVVSYLAKGHPLTIDKETLWKYPVEVNRLLYKRYGSKATNIVIEGVYEYDIVRLFELFPNIHQLTMLNVAIIRYHNFETYPTAMRKLCLVNSDIKHDEEWMPRMRRLERLFLQGNSTILINTTNLKSLTLINQRYELDSENRLCKNLRELTIDNWDRLPCISTLRHLERLRVIQSVDPRNRECVDALKTSSLDIHYFHILTEDTPIFRLNKYCFLHLQRFLGDEDCISFGNSHPVFRKLKVSRFTIDRKALEKRPLLEHYKFYERICAEVSELVVDGISSEEVGQLLPLISDGLRKLTLEKVRVPQEEFRNFLRRVNASLTFFKIYEVGMDVTDGLEKLQNIQEFEIQRSKVTERVLSFLRVNQRNFRRIVVRGVKLFVEEPELWRVILQMENLVELVINLDRPVATIPTVANGMLPKLEKLSLWFNELPRNLLRCLDGAALKELEIMGAGGDVREIVRFKGLRKLLIFYNEEVDLLVTVRVLPLLVELNLYRPPVEKLIELRSYLKQNQRDLKIKML